MLNQGFQRGPIGQFDCKGMPLTRCKTSQRGKQLNMNR